MANRRKVILPVWSGNTNPTIDDVRFIYDEFGIGELLLNTSLSGVSIAMLGNDGNLETFITNGFFNQEIKYLKDNLIGIKKDVDGIFYWTINGDWLLNENNKIKVEGRDGITPDFNVSGTSLFVKYGDSEWAELGDLQGPQGPQGDKGEKGDQGEKGEKGDTGETGPQGPQGEKGNDGTSVTILGSKENASELPETGNTNGDGYIIMGDLYVWSSTEWINVGKIQGPRGETGPQGPQGISGATGPQGPSGLTPDFNVSGTSLFVKYGESDWKELGNLQGPQGPQGDKGEKGDQGEKGEKGDTGETGPQGPQGISGATGPQGPSGLTPDFNVSGTSLFVKYGDSEWAELGDLQGPQGPQGDKGEKGDQGEKGEKGDTGETGPQGPQGDKGALDEEQIKTLKVEIINSAYSYTDEKIINFESSVTQTINEKISTAYRYQGTVKNYDILPTSAMTSDSVGYVYNVEEPYDKHPAGTNYAWTGEEWDALGGYIDLSKYSLTGHTHDYKPIQKVISDPIANGSALTFIDKISQDVNGVITPTKKSVDLSNYSIIGHTHPEYSKSDTATTESGHYTPSGTSSAYSGGWITAIKLDSKKHVTSVTTASTAHTHSEYSKSDSATTEEGHYTPSKSASTIDSGEGKYIHGIKLDSKGHVIGINENDLPTSLPANGGNADTVDNKHASDFATADHTHTQYLTGYTEQYKGTITEIKMNGASKGTSGVIDLGTVLTSTAIKVNSATTADNATTATQTDKVRAAISNGRCYLLGQDTSGTTEYYGLYKNLDVYMESGNLYASSDERLKDFVKDIDVDLDKLSKLPKKYFTWKNDEDKKLQIGTSAQKLYEIYPELVSIDKNDKYGVSYEKLSIIALAAVDKLYEENKNLKERLKKIEEHLGL